MNLNQIQQALKVPKSHTNTFANYQYRNCEDILEAVKPLLGDSILTLSDEIVQLGDRYYVKATAAISVDKENAIVVTAYAREPLEKKGSDASQITGAASSYARKYALNGLFLIDDTKDADGDDNASVASKTPRYDAVRAAQAKEPENRSGIALADKKEIARLLKLLGKFDKDTVGATVHKLTGLALIPEAVPDIIDRLDALKTEKEEEQ
jgi:hypothetical protein